MTIQYEQCTICGNENEMGAQTCDYCGENPGNGLTAQYQIYVDKNFNAEHMSIITKASGFLGEYERQGFRLSLRQLYYQFIAGALLPNTEQSYKRLGGIITSARLAGLISFDMIEDRGRSCYVPWSQTDPKSVLDSVEYGYSEDHWGAQDHYVEVWVEKDALSNVIERPCDRWQVPYMACKGYMSSSAQYEAGKRFKRAIENGKDAILIHLGDHDPSGLDMTRDNGDRVSLFAETGVEIRRIALNMDQIARYDPPPNPTKVTDSRAGGYMAEFGETCWELDALTPSVIDGLIEAEIKQYIDFSIWDETQAKQADNREILAKIGDNAGAVFDFINDNF